MTYIGRVNGIKGFRFMWPSGAIFMGVTATFDETLFPHMGTDIIPSATGFGKYPDIEQGDLPTPGTNSEDESDNSSSDESSDSSGDSDGSYSPFRPLHNSPHKGIKYDKGKSKSHEDADKTPPASPPTTTREVSTEDFLPRREDQDEWNELPRRSGRSRNIPNRPGNVYGEDRLPSDISRDIERAKYWKKTVGDKDPTSYRTRYNKSFEEPSVAGPSSGVIQNAPSNNSENSTEMQGIQDETYLVRIVNEGGNRLTQHLLNQAVCLSASADVVPTQFRDILRLPKQQQQEWKSACRDELEALNDRQVYEIVDLPPGRKTIKNKWVFAVKSNGRKRARLVVKGYSQIHGIEFDEIFSPVVRYETVRLMFALARLEGMYMTGIDVKTAFLYGKLDEEVYMSQPEGFVLKGRERKVMQLKRALYGLKQAALAWWKELESFMKTIGFRRTSSDAGIFVYKDKKGRQVIAIVYVDDGLFMGLDKKLVNEKKNACMKHWEYHDTGNVNEFLGMRITQNVQTITIDQQQYLKKVLERFNMINAKIAPTPLPSGYSPIENKDPLNPVLRQQYQSVIGSLLYLMLGTRPDIAFAMIRM